MGSVRVFLSQARLDAWLDGGKVDVQGDVMSVGEEGAKFQLRSAVHVIREVSNGVDPHELVGKVKDLEQLEVLGAEQYSQSLLLADNAYEVVEGFVGVPIETSKGLEDIQGHNLETATKAAVGDGNTEADIDRLARFFLGS